MDHALPATPLPTGDQILLAQGLLAELNNTLERARDERFRLIRLAKECEAQTGHAGAAPSQDILDRVLQRIEQLNDAVRARFEKLEEVDRGVDQRLQQLGRLESGIRDLTARFTEQVARARNFDREILDARRAIEAQATEVAGDLRAQVADAETHFARNAAQLQQLSESFAAQQAEADRVVAQTAGMIQRQVERAARETRQHIDGIATPFAQTVHDLVEASLSRLQETATEREQSLGAAADGIVMQARAKVEQAAEQMSDSLTEELRQQVESHRQAMTFRDAALRDELANLMAQRERELKDGVEEHLHVLVQQAREQARAVAQAAFEHERAQAEAAAAAGRDELAATLRSRVEAFRADAEATVGEALTAADTRFAGLVAQARDQAESLIEPFGQRLAATLDAHRLQLEEIVAQHEQADEERERALRQRMTAALAELRERTQTLQRDLVAHAQHAIKPVEAALRQSVIEARARAEQQLALASATPAERAEAPHASLHSQTAGQLERVEEAARALRVTLPVSAADADGREVTTLPIIDTARLADSLQNLNPRAPLNRRDADAGADQAA